MEQTKKINMTAMSDKTNSNTTAKKEEPAWEHKVAMKVSGVSIAVNLLLSLFKLLAGILAHSGAMISDAIHSASDVGSTFVVIVGVNLSSKKSDKEHQYGHERMECVSSIILSGLLLATVSETARVELRTFFRILQEQAFQFPENLHLFRQLVLFRTEKPPCGKGGPPPV